MKTFWKKKLPACLLALALLAGTVPMASAASADLTYDVDEDSGVWLDADDFQEIYEDDNGGYLEYVEFTDYDDFDDYGYFTFEDFDRYGFDDVDSKALENYEFYYDRADADDYDIDLDTLRSIGERELEGVRRSDAVIVLTPRGRGTHAELGMALALGKRVYLCHDDDTFFKCDENTSAFYWLPQVNRIVGSLEDIARALLEAQNP